MMKMKQFYQTKECSFYSDYYVDAMSCNSCSSIVLLLGNAVTIPGTIQHYQY
jgi:hypothetical protein